MQIHKNLGGSYQSIDAPEEDLSFAKGPLRSRRWLLASGATVSLAALGACSDGRTEKIVDLEVTATGEYTLDAKAIHAGELTAALRAAHDQSPTLLLRINAHQVARHEVVMRALESAKAAGITNIAFSTSAPQ